ncbi:MAG: uridine kinase [Anaerolineae bacterium]|jgi:uridine kinase
MIGDKLIIEKHHTERAAELCDLLPDLVEPEHRIAISIAGESGAGKSELAYEIYRQLNERGIPTEVLQQDDYFVFPPQTNHEMRRRNLEQVGPYEVKLDFLDSNLRSFKRGESPIYKPLVVYDEDRITRQELDVADLAVLIAEGTYTSLLEFVDLRVFIDRDYRQTLEARKRRARDRWEPFIQDVLEREHEVITQHKALVDLVIPPDFGTIQKQ